MFTRIPDTEGLTLGRVSDGSADDENGCRHVILRK